MVQARRVEAYKEVPRFGLRKFLGRRVCDWCQGTLELGGVCATGSVYPDHEEIQILIDGEKIMHTPEAKAALRDFGITTMSWPKYSPDFDPQENLWARAEVDLRKAERMADTFDTFKRRVLAACESYPGAEKLIPSMAARIKAVIASGGAMTKH